jgi:hypothetical protein
VGSVVSFPVDLAKFLPGASKTVMARTGIDQGDAYVRQLLNGSSPQLYKWRSALARAQSGGAPATIAVIGDSLGMGAGGGTGGTTNCNAAKVVSWPYRLAQLFTNAGIPASGFACWGDNFVPGGLSALELYDPNISIPTKTNWSMSLSPVTRAFLNSSDTTALNFTPPEATDKIDIYYIQNSGFGTFTVKDGIGGTTLSTVTPAASAAIAKASITRTLSANTISIQRTGTGTSLYIVGIDTWNSAKHLVKVWGCSCYGLQSGDLSGYSGAPWDPRVGLDVPAPDLVIIGPHTNDKEAGVSAATMKTNVQTIITARKAAGADVILTQMHQNSSTTNDSLLPAYSAAYYDLARTNSCPLVDFRLRMQSFAIGNAAARYFDNIHLTKLGQADEANGVFSLVSPQ